METRREIDKETDRNERGSQKERENDRQIVVQIQPDGQGAV